MMKCKYMKCVVCARPVETEFEQFLGCGCEQKNKDEKSIPISVLQKLIDENEIMVANGDDSIYCVDSELLKNLIKKAE